MQQLRERINCFQRDAQVYLSIVSTDEPVELALDADIDDEHGESRKMESLADIALCLPSRWEKSKKLGKTDLAKQEAQLRQAQANDALEEIRVALAYKALVFRRDVQSSTNNRQTTRAWDNVHGAEDKISQLVKTYQAAYNALKRLHSVPPTLQAICDQDLKMPSQILEQDRIGQSTASLPWFWRIGLGESEEGKDGWVAQSRLSAFLSSCCSPPICF
jgi:hypothetical protein